MTPGQRETSNESRGRAKSKDSKLRLRIREKSKDRLSSVKVSGDATSFDILRQHITSSSSSTPQIITSNVDKIEKSKHSEIRKLSKQNTYIFQNERNAKYQDKNKDPPPPVPEHSLSYRLKRSMEGQDYSLVLDAVRQPHTIQEQTEDEDDSIYAEICDNYYSSNNVVQSTSSEQELHSSSFVNACRISAPERFISSTDQNWSFSSLTNNSRSSTGNTRSSSENTRSSTDISRSSSDNIRNRSSDRSNGTYGTSISSSSDDHHYSFTLLRQEVGNGSFMKTSGFSAG